MNNNIDLNNLHTNRSFNYINVLINLYFDKYAFTSIAYDNYNDVIILTEGLGNIHICTNDLKLIKIITNKLSLDKNINNANYNNVNNYNNDINQSPITKIVCNVSIYPHSLLLFYANSTVEIMEFKNYKKRNDKEKDWECNSNSNSNSEYKEYERNELLYKSSLRNNFKIGCNIHISNSNVSVITL